MLNKEDMTNSVCLLSSSPSTEKKSSKYDDHIKHKSLVPNFHMAWATLEKAVTEDTEPKGKTFFWEILGFLVSGQYATRQASLCSHLWPYFFLLLNSKPAGHCRPFWQVIWVDSLHKESFADLLHGRA
jgi:hypothetical protein